MGLLDFVDTTFILTLGIILLISGGIMIYCYRRLNVLENGLIQQGRVIQDFITNYQIDMKQNMINNMNPANMYNEMVPLNNLIDTEKIVVSDNDEDDDDDYDDDDDEDDDDYENDEINNTTDKIDQLLDNNEDDDDDDEDDNDIKPINIHNVGSNKDQDAIKELKIDDINDIDLKSLEETLDFSDNLNSSRVIPISDNDGFDISKKNPTRLRVDELRELVVNKNLKSNEEASKLKKGDLIKLLE